MDNGISSVVVAQEYEGSIKEEKEEFWCCADPACKTQNTFDTNICEKCKLSNKYIYEKSGKWGQTKVKKDDDTDIVYKKWTVVNTHMNTINIRDSKMQNDFVKFTDGLSGFLKYEQSKAHLEKANVDDPDECEIYIIYSEDRPYRVQFKSFNYSDADPECPDAGDKVEWLVNFMDIGNWEVVDPNDLVKLPSCSFQQGSPLMKRCILEHIRFKTVNLTKRAKINSWMKEQLLNKDFVINFNERTSNSRFSIRTTLYADILLEDGEHFSAKIVDEFEDYLIYNENLNMESFIYV